MENNYNEWENGTQQPGGEEERTPYDYGAAQSRQEEPGQEQNQSRQDPYQQGQGQYQQDPQQYRQDPYQQAQPEQDPYQQGQYRQNQYQQEYGQQNAGPSYYDQTDASRKRDYADYSRIPEKKKGNAGKFVAVGVAACLIVGLMMGVGYAGTNYMRQYVMSDQTGDTASSGETGSDISIATTAPVASKADAEALGDVSDIVEAVMPAVVSISSKITTTSDWFGQQVSQQSEGSGSGIILSQDKENLYIATNNHVVEDSEELSAKFIDDEVVTAQIKGTDEDADLAVVAVALSDIPKETRDQIKVAVLGDSDALKVGEPVVAVGNALGYGQAVTNGIVSAKERDVVLTDKTMKLLQTNAAINPGNSGGPLLNASGQVIGINSVKYASSEVEGMGFAIPIATAKPILEDLINEREIPENQQAALGIIGQTISQSAVKGYGFPQGVYVREVNKNSAAEKAGIQFGDIITKFDGRDVTSMESLTALLGKKAAGDKVDVTVMRQSENGQYKENTVSVTLQKKAQTDTQEKKEQDGGNGNGGSRIPENGNTDDIMEYFREYFGY